QYIWNGTAWAPASVDGAGSGITTIGTINSQTKSANGAVINGNNLVLQTADATNVGLVSITAQTLAGDKSFSGNLAVTGTATTTLGGTLTVSGVAQFNGNLTVSGSQFTNNGSTLNTAAAITNLAAGGAIGSAATTVDVDTTFTVTQTTAGQTLSLPSPTTTTAGRIVYVINTGTASFIMHGVTVAAGASQQYVWTGSAWTAASIDGSGSGVTTIGTINGQTKSANGAVISGNSLFLQTADATNVGLVSTTAQTLAGDKTFSGTTALAVTTIAGTTNINTSGTANTSIGNATGTLSVVSASTFSGTLTVTGSQFTNSGSTLNTAASIANLAAGGAIGTATSTVDVDTTFNVNQTTAGQTLTLPSPTTTTGGRIAYVSNVGTASFTMYSVTVAAGATQQYIWNGTAWAPASVDGAGSGITTIGTINSQTKSANGAVINGTSIFLQTADATNVGLVSTGAQFFAGNKTFNDLIYVGSSSDTVTTDGVALRKDVSNNLQIDSIGGVILNLDSNNNDTNTLFAIRANASSTDLLTVAQTGAVNFSGDVTVAAGKYISLVGGITSSRPASPTAGMLYYDSTTNQMLQYNGTKWVSDRNSSTKIVAANNSSQSAKDGADFVANGDTGTASDGDQVQINQALTAIASLGGTVYLTEGTYVIDGSISIPNNVTLMGADNGTVITIPNTLSGQNTTGNIDMIINTDTTTGTKVNVKDIRIEGNRANQTLGTQNAISFTNLGSGGGSTSIVGANISNVHISQVRTTGILLLNSGNHVITGSVLHSNTSNGIKIQNTNNTTLSGSLIQGNLDGIEIENGQNNTVTGNNFQGNTVGIYLSSNSHSNSISGNTAQSNTKYGIHLNSAYNNVITSNNVLDSGGIGIYLQDSSTNNVTGNKARNNGGTTNDGILLRGSDQNSITNNDINDSSCASSCFAINLDDSANDLNYLSNNRFSDTDGAATASIRDVGTGTVYANQATGENGSNLLVRTAESTNAFNVQNAAGNDVISVDTISGELELGKASTLTGKLQFRNAANAFDVTLQVASFAQDSTITIPATGATDTVCLQTLANCIGTAATSIGALDGGTANANGATISSNTLYLQSASANYPGLVTTGAQTLAGAKTFTSNLAVTGNTTGDVEVFVQNTNSAGYAELQTGNNLGSSAYFGIGGSTVPDSAYVNRAYLYSNSVASGVSIISGGGDIRLYSGGESTAHERLRITAGGALGFNTVNPNGQFNIGGTFTSGGHLFTVDSVLNVSANTNLLGINLQPTLNPATNFSVVAQYVKATIGADAGQIVSDYIGISVDNPIKSGTGTITNAYQLKITGTTVATNNYSLYVDGGDVVFNGGKLAVGNSTAASAAKLEVDTDPSENVVALSVNQEDTSTTREALRIVNAGNGNSVFIGDDGTSTDSTPFLIDASGRVGIGKSTPTFVVD
ncbi:MAG: hypothetical protein JWO69_1872, partial [Thermoleophilia bacterium]|nr:hypothetical protein [Thermoleophilia bacterium]